MKYFTDAREKLVPKLVEFLDGSRHSLSDAGMWSEDAIRELRDFSVGGKLIRGGLALLGAEIGGGKSDPERELDLAAAMELFQSAFLIHDDIMDRDLSRRGAPSYFYRFAKKAEVEGLRDHYHQGEALGICGGDIAFFLGFELLVRSGLDAAGLNFCIRELSLVGLAQMKDVWFGASPALPGVDEILELYRLKTGRYSFSLPLAAGAMLRGADKNLVDALMRIGELMGLVFQIRDDELGLYGKEERLGKPLGTDVREGKKTIFWVSLMARLQGADRTRIEAWLGSPECGAAQLADIHAAMERSGAKKAVAEISQRLAADAKREILALACNDANRAILLDLLDFVGRREK